MARPLKDGVSYWPFDVDLFEDKKFKLIRAEYGVKGIYIALMIINSVYKDNGYYKSWDDDDCFLMSEGVGDGCTPKLVAEVLAGCVRRGLFDEALFQMFGVLSSPGIQKRFISMVKNSRNKIVLIKEYLLIDLKNQKGMEGVLNKVVLISKNDQFSQRETRVSHGENPINKIEREIEREMKEREKGASPFSRTPPTATEVAAYCAERGSGIDPQRFWDYYTSCGWRLGNGAPIRDWQACVRNWERREQREPSKAADEATSEYEALVERYIPRYRKKEEE